MADVPPRIDATDPNGNTTRPLSARDTQPTLPKYPNDELHASKDHALPATYQHEKPDLLSKNVVRQPDPQVERPKTSRSIDPLSQLISEHTNASTSPKGYKQSDDTTNGVDAGGNGQVDSNENRSNLDSSRGNSSPAIKEKKNRVSIFSRMKIGAKKKDSQEDESRDDFNSPDDDRPEGADAKVYVQPVDNMGYSPQFQQPPAYIKMRAKYKKEREFDKVFLAQELDTRKAAVIAEDIESQETLGDAAIWALEWSKDGRYLASGGQDTVVRIWAVISSHQDRKAHENQEDAKDSSTEHVHLSAPMFNGKPHRTFEGHTGPVLDLSWSKNSFLLSSSYDKSIRLWHTSRNECLCAFQHSNFVTSIQFHPKDDRFFLAGSLDSKLRLWSIPDKSVAYWNSAPDMITAVAFTPDGKTAMAGCLHGLCLFYDTEGGLKYQTQIHVKSTHGKNARGSKITGIKAMTFPPNSLNGEVMLLITSNDSRVRLYNLRDKSLQMKFKGNENTSSQMHACFSDDGRYIICGSEDKKVLIWSTSGSENDKQNKHPVESFKAHASPTAAIMAPARAKRLLGVSEDPLYDLCNPPPVTLISRAELESGVKPLTTTGTLTSTTQTTKPPSLTSPSPHSRATHPAGNILITADASGILRVFRQDCASDKRGDASSLRRMGSLMRRSSTRSALSHASSAPSHPRERVQSWRNSIGASSNSVDKNRRPPGKEATVRSPRIGIESSGDASPASAGSGGLTRPEMGRENSTMYFRDGAWHDEVLQQLQAAKKTDGQGGLRPMDSRRNSSFMENGMERRLSGVSALSVSCEK